MLQAGSSFRLLKAERREALSWLGAIRIARDLSRSARMPPAINRGRKEGRTMKILPGLLAALMAASVLAGDMPPPPAAESATHPLPAKWKKFELCEGFKHLAR